MAEQTQESLKVYELAKELGIDSFALLDKLKQINIEVKSHMSSLAADQTKAIREAFKNEKAEEAKTKSTATKKRAAPGAATAASGATAAPPAAVKKTKVTKKTSAPGISSTDVAPAEAAPAKRKIIKRRTGAETAAEAEPAPAKIEKSPAEAIESARAAEEIESAAAESAEAAAKETAEQQAQNLAEQLEQKKASAIAAYAPRPNAPGTKAARGAPVQRVVEKDELLEEFASRKLKIVQQAPPSPPPGQRRSDEPTYRTPGGPTAKKPGFQPPGAKPQESSDMFQPFTSYVSKEEEGRKKGSGAATTKNPEDVRISDFRKRELVFQPKRKKLPPGKVVKQTLITTPSAQKRKIKIEDKIVVSELAQRMGEKVNTIIAKLMALGTMATVNQTIDFDTASLIAAEFGYEVENVAFKEAEAFAEGDHEEKLRPRPPIITVMGHVDHGKTSLLDAIRNANVVAGEAGGITQHIGAYSVTVDGKSLTFLDTPGHEAFANMRSRGANVTDIVVLVVAADDSIMPQTKEAIMHAQNAKVPIIVAANKMDKPAANIEKLKKDLSANNVLVEEWGGEVPMVPISALKKTGIKELLETISLQAEVLDLKADSERSAEGVILEARMEKGRGVVTDLLVRKGTLHIGDYVVVGPSYGRVRAMTDDHGKAIKEVLPGFPAEVIGLTEVPSAGDSFQVAKDEVTAKEVADNRRKKLLEEKAQALAPKPMSLEDLMSKLPTPGLKELNLLVKADVFGSAEAIKESIEKIESSKVKAKVIQSGVGVITENDVLLAKTANAIILGFNSKPDAKARETAKREKVDVRHYSIIYELLDDVRAAMENLLEPIRKETPMGKAEVKQTFAVSKIGTIAGCVVADGKVTRNAFARVTRGKDVVHEGKIVSLKRFKDDVSETIKGQECGIGVENYEAYMPGDIISVFHVEFVKQTL